MFELTESQKQRLKLLANDKETLEALKRFFLNHYLGFVPPSEEIETTAARYIAMKSLNEFFRDLENLRDRTQQSRPEEQIAL